MLPQFTLMIKVVKCHRLASLGLWAQSKQKIREIWLPKQIKAQLICLLIRFKSNTHNPLNKSHLISRDAFFLIRIRKEANNSELPWFGTIQAKEKMMILIMQVRDLFQLSTNPGVHLSNKPSHNLMLSKSLKLMLWKAVKKPNWRTSKVPCIWNLSLMNSEPIGLSCRVMKFMFSRIKVILSINSCIAYRAHTWNRALRTLLLMGETQNLTNSFTRSKSLFLLTRVDWCTLWMHVSSKFGKNAFKKRWDPPTCLTITNLRRPWVRANLGWSN